MRKEIKYALVLMRWLQMEGARSASLDELWADFVFSARKLGFCSAKLTLPDGQHIGSNPNRRLATRSARHELQGGRSGTLELEAPSAGFSSPEGQPAGSTPIWGDRQYSRVGTPKLFEVLSELLAEGWMKATSFGSPHWGSPSAPTRAATPGGDRLDGQPAAPFPAATDKDHLVQRGLGVQLQNQRTFDGLHHLRRVGLDARLEPFQDLPVAPDEELREIPFDVPRNRGFFPGQHQVKGVATGAVDLNLFKKRKSHLVF